jgi:hypothetical protein
MVWVKSSAASLRCSSKIPTRSLLALICYLLLESQAKKLRAKNEAAM